MNLSLFIGLFSVDHPSDLFKAGFLKNELSTIELKLAFLFQNYVIPPLNNLRFSQLFTEYVKPLPVASFLNLPGVK